jgi:hypothetical protein
MPSATAITRVHRDGGICGIDHILNERITALSVFISDFVLLSLTLFGVLRWKQVRLTGGILRLMYTQVGISRLAVTTLTIQFDIGHRD